MVAKKRHLAKAISWRIVGTLDTMIIAGLITGNPWTGITIGTFEIFTKLILYYGHERAWYKLSKFGVDQ